MTTGAPTPAALVGRDQAWAAATDRLRALADGGGGGLVVTGEPGAGKTLLAELLTDEARARGLVVRRAAAPPPGVERPRGVLATALAGERADRAAPADTAADPATTLGQLLAGPAPVVLAIDDAHWADRAALRVLERLAPDLARLPLLLVLAFRPAPRPPSLDDLLDALPGERTTRVTLGPLDASAVGRLLAGELGRTPGKRLLREAARARGNPFLVLELARAVAEAGLLERVGDQVELVPSPGRDDRRLTGRLAHLDPATSEVLRAAAVLGVPATPSELSSMLGVPVAGLVGPVEEALRLTVLEEVGDRLGFRHDLLRAALYASTPEQVRVHLHRTAAAAAEASGAPTSQVLRHRLLAGDPVDDALLAWMDTAAAERAAATAPAVDVLDEAASHLPAGHPSRPALDAALARALLLDGRPAAAERTARAVLAAGPGTDVATRAGRTLVDALLAQGRVGAAAAAATDPRPETAVAVLLGDEPAAAAGPARLLLDRPGEEALALALLAASAALTGDDHTARRHAAQVRDLARHLPALRARRWPPALWLGLAASLGDRGGEALADLAAAADGTPPPEAGWTAGLRHAFAAEEHERSGRWDDAWAETSAGLDASREGAALGVLILLGVAARISGRRALPEAAAAADRAAAEVAAGATVGGEWAALGRAAVLEGGGDPAGALAVLLAAVESAADAGRTGRLHLLTPDVVRLALASGEGDVAAWAARLTDRRAEGSTVPSVVAAAHRCRGLVDRDPDRLLAAAAVLEGTGRPLERAAAAVEAALALADRGRPDDLRGLLAPALATYASVGATLDADRVRAALRARGLRPPRATRPAEGWDALTPAELQVVALVAEGATNQQIADRLYLSRRTVETHLRRVFTKLGTSSRVELAVAATRRGLAG
ncbi:MAG: DUF2791 family P-loop domain-containing protein [Acidimicrobiales bacterium]|nr:DUF2791 family P-loop domain-containing protein [Acidimicrobiales bacterium]